MKMACHKEALLNNLNIVSRAVSTRTTLPILECVLLTCADEGFTLFANDLAMAIESRRIEAEVEEPGEVALEAKLFYEIIRHMPEDMVSIQTGDNYVTTITSGNSEFRILGVSVEEFPGMPEVEEGQALCISAGALRDMIKQTIFSVATENAKPGLMGELLEIKEGSFHAVAVDGFRVSYRRHVLENNAKGDFSVIVPPKALNEISKMSVKEEEEVSVYYTDKHILFEVDGYRVVSRLIDGEFIKYEQIFTEDFNTKITVNRQTLLMSLERVSIIASKELKKNPIHLSVLQNSVIISSQTEAGTVKDEIEVITDGNDLEISFNPRYLIEAVRAIDEVSISVQFTNPLSPCIIKGVESDDGKYLVLPLRLR